MEESILIGLVQNIAILLSFSMLYDYFWSRNENGKNLFFKIGSGIILGGTGIVLILTPWHFVPGIFFDTRSIMLSISGLFFGLIPTITAMAITGLYRIYLGGGGALMGIAAVITSGTIGLLWRHFRPSWRIKNHYLELAGMGVIVHIIILICTLLLPPEIRWETLKNTAFPIILIYPFATVLLGVLMLNQAENWKTRRALKISEKRFRTIFEQATDALFITDSEENVLDVNQQACKNLGYTKKELLKLKISDIDSKLNSNEKAKKFFQNFASKTGKIFESEYRKKDGSTFPVEINASSIDLDGTQLGLCFVRDISDRKHAEQKLIRMGQHYQTLIEKAPDGIVLINEDGSFKFVSPSARKMFGYSSTEEVVGNATQFTHPDDLPMVISILKNLIREPDRVPTIQYRFIDKTGTWKWVESTFSNLLADPSIEAIVINFRDITDRKNVEDIVIKLNEELESKVIERTAELEKLTNELIENQATLLNVVEDLNLKSEELKQSGDQLQFANKELEAFSYSISHDLRAPLRAISGFVNILKEDYENVLDDEGKRICNVIHANAIKMGQLIDDLLSFSRLIRSELSYLEIDMEKMVKNIIAEFEVTAKSIPINWTIDALHPAIGDSNLIKQVWINLISNAIKYSSKNNHPQIHIGAEQKEDETIYFIKDNGVGFDTEYKHKLFGVFQRLHKSTEFEGTGVGLAIVQRIINRHNGRIWAESELENGAIFYFTLPKTINS